MRYLFSAIVLAFLLPSCAIFSPQGCPLSISGGIGSSRIVGDPSWTDPLGGLISIESRIIEVNKQSSLNAGIGYSFQGSGYKETYGSGKVHLGYVNIPFLYTYLIKNGFFAEAGLQPGFLVSAKDKLNGNTHDYKDAMKKFELGLPIGAGYRTKTGLGIGARFIPGLTNNHKAGNSRNLLMLAIISYRINGNNKE